MARDIAGRWGYVTALKREGRLAEAVAVLEQEARDQEEQKAREDWFAPAAFEELARLYARLGNPRAEVEILERFARLRGEDPDLHPDHALREARTRLATAVEGPALAACPHCGVVLDPPPKASRKCPECRAEIVVRTDRATGAKVYLTPEEAEQLEVRKTAQKARAETLKRIGRFSPQPQTAFDVARDELVQRWGGEPSDGDVFWLAARRRCREIEERLMSRGRDWEGTYGVAEDFYELERVNRLMADHLRSEGQPAQHILQVACEYSLNRYASMVASGGWSGTRTELIIWAHDLGCEACAPDHQRRLTLAEALASKPLPHPGCPYCGCLYSDWSPQQGDNPPPGSVPAEEPKFLRYLRRRLSGGS
jgi:predicted Zn-ribbon and HTH transcriptional regulator